MYVNLIRISQSLVDISEDLSMERYDITVTKYILVISYSI